MSKLSRIRRGRQQLPPRIFIYGLEKIGKTTFASHAPNPIFLPTEDGLTSVDVPHYPKAEELAEVNRDLLELETEQHDFETVVIDSASALERLIHDQVCRDYNVTTIEKAAGGYGKGYTEALKEWRSILDQCDRLRAKGMGVILIGHNSVEEFSDPDTSTYSQYRPRLHKKASQLVCEWADAVLFACKRARVKNDQTKEGRVIALDNDRILRCVGGPACVAGNRYGIQDDLPLSWDAFVAAMNGGN